MVVEVYGMNWVLWVGYNIDASYLATDYAKSLVVDGEYVRS